MVRTRVAIIGLVAVLLAGTVTVTSRPTPASALTPAAVPTQWIAQQYTELLGRAPSPAEWQFWIGYYQGQSACTSTNLLAVTKYLTGTAQSPNPVSLPPLNSTESSGLYPAATPLDKATRLSAVVRAVSAHDPNDSDWGSYFSPYLRDTAAPATAWANAVNSAGSWGLAITGVGSVCNTASSSRGFGFSRPIDLRAKVKAEFTPSLTLSRTQAQLKTALTTAAAATSLGARTVTLLQGEVIRVGGAANANQGLEIPAGVTVTSENMPAYVEPAPGSAPKGVPYARMGRIVLDTSPGTNSTVVDGSACTGDLCRNTGMVRLGVGAHLSGVWVDGQGAGDTNSKMALVETNGSAAPNSSTVYDDATSVIASRLSEPGRDGTGLRLRGNSAGTPCVNEKVTGNLVTAYSSLHQFDPSGQAQWADGIVVSCEQAVVSSNSIVDVTDTAILVLGSLNRAQDVSPATKTTVAQRSEVRNNFILSAGLDAHVALGVDAMGECKSDRDGPMVPCLDQTVPRDMTGTRIHDNTFWTGARTSFDIGLMIGGGALWGDHQVTNAFSTTTPPTLMGAMVDHNTTGPTGTGGTSARVNIGIDIHDMLYAWVTNNTLTFPTPVDGNSRSWLNKCPMVAKAIGPWEKATATTDLVFTAAEQNATSRGCLIGEPPAAGQARVTIKTDGSGFETVWQDQNGKEIRRPFHAWGGDLPYPQPLATMVDDLRAVRRMGANTVRLLIDLEDIVGAPTQPGGAPAVKQSALNDLAAVGVAAGQMGIYLDITGIGIAYHHGPGPNAPYDPTPPYTSWYDQLGTIPANATKVEADAKAAADEKLRWKAQTTFWSEIAKAMKNQPSILLYDLVNEPTFGATANTPAATWCFSDQMLTSTERPEDRDKLERTCWNQNPVKTLTDPLDSSRQRDPKDVIASWISGMRKAIRDQDTTHPISVGVIGAIATKGPGCPGVYNKTNLDPHVDLMMPHIYPGTNQDGTDTVADNARQVAECKIDQKTVDGITTPQKPLIVEETWDFGYPATFEKFMAATSSLSSGYLGHFGADTPSRLSALSASNLQIGTEDSIGLAVVQFLYWQWDATFLRNNLLRSPAGQGIMAY